MKKLFVILLAIVAILMFLRVVGAEENCVEGTNLNTGKSITICENDKTPVIPCKKQWTRKSISLHAYQGYESRDPDKYKPNRRYERKTIKDALRPYPDWTVEYIYWEGDPIDPNFKMSRYGYILIKKRACKGDNP